MNPIYMPILKAKSGEFTALKHTRERTAKKILPLFELPRLTPKLRTAARFRNSPAKTAQHIDELTKSIANASRGSRVLIDIFSWRPDSKIESGEHVLSRVYEDLTKLGVKMCPVVGYDRWDDIEYKHAICQISVPEKRLFCIRIDAESMQDFGEPEYFAERLKRILNDIGRTPKQCAVLIDFGDVTHLSIDSMLGSMDKGVSLLANWGFRFIAIAGCSLPASISDAVPDKNSTKEILRREMIAWQQTQLEHTNVPLVFADFGIRSPRSEDDIVAPHINGKIRYTIMSYHFVARGQSIQHGDGSAQNYRLAKLVARSRHYLGSDFSWGDEQLLAHCDPENSGPGNATTWIAIDTNHHIEAVVRELFELERQRTTVQARSTET